MATYVNYTEPEIISPSGKPQFLMFIKDAPENQYRISWALRPDDRMRAIKAAGRPGRRDTSLYMTVCTYHVPEIEKRLHHIFRHQDRGFKSYKLPPGTVEMICSILAFMEKSCLNFNGICDTIERNKMNLNKEKCTSAFIAEQAAFTFVRATTEERTALFDGLLRLMGRERFIALATMMRDEFDNAINRVNAIAASVDTKQEEPDVVDMPTIVPGGAAPNVVDPEEKKHDAMYDIMAAKEHQYADV